ncbi:MAG: prolyl oligopeptidase family serine peptidase [Chthoniobacterales bacterium]
MKTNKLIIRFVLAVVACLVLGGVAVADVVPKSEVFGKASDGTVLHWQVYTPTTPGPWPAVLIIHGGGFNSGSPDSSGESIIAAQDMAAAGYIAFSIEYRLAPPGALPGQVSDGRFPDQSDDVKVAIRAARADQRCNGQVGAVGGSAGGYQTAFCAATGTIGEDRLDLGVSLSGLYDLTDYSPTPTLPYYTTTVVNYVGVPATDTEAMRAASPAWLADSATAPLLLVNTVEDSMPYSQLGDMIAHLDSLGVTNYQAITLPGGEHSFANWPVAKGAAMTFLANGFAGILPPPPAPTPPPGSTTRQLLNVSTRARAGVGDDVIVGGFIVSGTTNKRVVLRALAPSLAQYGVNDTLGDPVISLYSSTGTLMESNDNRLDLGGIVNPLLPPDPAESYLTAILPPGSYTTVVEGANATSGVAIVEVYDITPADSRVGNISTRADIAFPGDVMVGGFIIGGSDATEVIVRALGPSLALFGIANPLPNPMLEVYNSNGAQIATNDDWRSTQAQEIQATNLAPGSNREAAILTTLVPGTYTAVVRDAGAGSGIGLVEVYNLEL